MFFVVVYIVYSFAMTRLGITGNLYVHLNVSQRRFSSFLVLLRMLVCTRGCIFLAVAFVCLQWSLFVRFDFFFTYSSLSLLTYLYLCLYKVSSCVIWLIFFIGGCGSICKCLRAFDGSNDDHFPSRLSPRRTERETTILSTQRSLSLPFNMPQCIY